LFDLQPNRHLFRVVIVLAGLSFIGLGLGAFRKGFLFYPNWWGGVIFVPLAVIFGVIFILSALFKPKIFR